MSLVSMSFSHFGLFSAEIVLLSFSIFLFRYLFSLSVSFLFSGLKCWCKFDSSLLGLKLYCKFEMTGLKPYRKFEVLRLKFYCKFESLGLKFCFKSEI